MSGARVVCTRRGFLSTAAVAAGAGALWLTRRARGVGWAPEPGAEPRRGPALRHHRWREVVVSPEALGPSGEDLAG